MLLMSAGTIVSWVLSGFFIKTITNHAISLEFPLAYTHVMEPLLIRLHSSVIMGILMVLPFISCYIVLFLSPEKQVFEKKRFFSIATGASLCFIAGAALSVFLILPHMFEFLKLFIPSRMAMPYIPLSNLVGKSIAVSMLIGVLFELPVIAFIFAKIGILVHVWLINKRKYVIVAIFITGALLTPPEPLSQLMLAIPLILLYEISIKVARMTNNVAGIEITK